MDLRLGLAEPLPEQVICELFGMPEDVRPGFGRIIRSIFHTSADPAEVMATQRALVESLVRLVDHKRAHPGEDMTSALISAHDDDEAAGSSRLSEQELRDTLTLIIGAGHETTVNLIANAVHALLSNPDQLSLVREGAATWTDVIDETLRWRPSATSAPLRFAVEDIDVDGVTIRKGDVILAALGAANRDFAQHGDDADRFDLTRPSRGTHLSFGHGVHFCLGAPLARLEAMTALPAFFSRFPDAALAVTQDELKPLESFISQGFRTLPLILT